MDNEKVAKELIRIADEITTDGKFAELKGNVDELISFFESNISAKDSGSSRNALVMLKNLRSVFASKVNVDSIDEFKKHLKVIYRAVDSGFEDKKKIMDLLIGDFKKAINKIK